MPRPYTIQFGGLNMNRNVIAAIAFVLLGLGCIGAYKLLSGWLAAKKEAAAQADAKTGASDAKVNRTIRTHGDGYSGYFFMNSPEMKIQAARRGLGTDFTDDGGKYAQRLEKFAKGECDAIVLPVNSYLEHGFKHNYPGVIVASIAESRGADVILGFEDKLPTGKVSDMNDASHKIVYTADSPSSFLIDLTIVDFDLFNLKTTNTWRDEVASSTEVFEKAKRREGNFFVMWEPDASRALREIPGLKVVWASDRFSGYIVDVFVFRRDFVKAHEDDVVRYFEAYFSAMRAYKSDRARLFEDMRAATGLKQDEIEPVLQKIDWYDLQANCNRQFGLKTGIETTSVEGLVNTILACTNVLVKTGKLQKDPLGDPYRIINTSILKQVQARLPADIGSQAGKRAFTQLPEEKWKSLRPIGTLRVEPIAFQQGSATLDVEGEEQIDKIAELFNNNYPDTRIVIKGHTSPGSDEDENVKLSRERADAVLQRLIGVHAMSANRFRVEGKGSSEPPAKRPGESPRTYMYRVPRVEFELYLDSGF